MEDATQLPDDLELVGSHEELLLARARGVDVDAGEDALVSELAIELELHVAGALELFEDHLVHARAGLDQRGREDRERSAVLDVAGGAEESLRRIERCGVHATREDATGGGSREVVGAAKTGHRVEQNDDVVPQLDKTLGTLDRKLGHDGVVLGRTIEGGGDDLALDRALHVGDFLRALVDEHDHEMALGVVGDNRIGDRLEHHRLARLGRRHDETALALADRGHEVDHARGEVAGLRLQAQALLGVEGRELGELRPLARLLGVGAVDRVDADEGVELLAPLPIARLPHGTGDRIALAQAVLLDHGERDVDVIGAGQVARGAHEGVVVEDIEDARDRDEHIVIGDLDVLLAETAGAALPTIAEPIAAPTTSATRATILIVVAVIAVVAAVVTAVVAAVVAACVAAGAAAIVTAVLAAIGVAVVAAVVIAVVIAGGALALTLLGRVGLVRPVGGTVLVSLVGRATLSACSAVVGGASVAAGAAGRLLGTDRLDECALAHGAGPRDAQGLGELLELGQQHSGEPGSRLACGGGGGIAHV